MSETPYHNRRVSTWRRVLGISHGLTVPMNNYTDPIQLLTTELDTLSSLTGGQRLLQRVQATGIDTMRATTASDLARAIEWNPRAEQGCHPTLAALVPLATNDREVAIIVLVALHRPLRAMTYSLSRFAADSDVGMELITTLWGALVENPGIDVEQLLEVAFVRTRRTVRLEHRRHATSDSIEGLDFADTAQGLDGLSSDLLATLVDEGVVCRGDADLVRATRVEGATLREHARRQGLAYKTAHQRRLRAERAIANYLAHNSELR